METNQENLTPRNGFFRRQFTWRVMVFAVICAVTLLALFHAEENWRGRHQWQKYKHELEASGETFDEAGYIPPPVPDDQNFAMTPFLKPVFEFEPGTQKVRDTNALNRIDAFEKTDQRIEDDLKQFGDALKQHATNSDQIELARRVMADLADKMPVIEELRLASHRPYSRFNIAYSNPDKMAILLRHLKTIKNVCGFLRYRAQAELVLGQTDGAFHDVMLILYLSGSIASEPIVISQLVRVSTVEIALTPLRQGLTEHRWTEPQLREFQQTLARIELVDGMRQSFAGESKFFVNSLFEKMKTERDPIGTLAHVVERVNPQQGLAMLAAQFLIPRGWIDMEQANYHRYFHESYLSSFDARAKTIDPKHCDAADRTVEQLAQHHVAAIFHHRWMTIMLMPSLSRAAAKAAQGQSDDTMAIVVCGLERSRLQTGKYPDQVSALVPAFLNEVPHDSLTGQELKYSCPDGKNFKLYSVGWNETDEGGVLAYESGKTPRQDIHRGDWVWKAD